MPIDRMVTRRHAEWLALIDIAGPFLSMPVLTQYFPAGLDVNEHRDGEVRRRVRLAYEEWLDNQSGNRADPAIHGQWLRFVLAEALEMSTEMILEGQGIPSHLHYHAREHGEELRPQLVIQSPYEKRARLLIVQYPQQQELTKAIAGKKWKATPVTRMMELLRNTGTRLGLVTNGQQWTLVDAPPNETTGYYTWEASLWTEEPLTLQSFRTLLCQKRFFGVPDEETLEALLTESAQKQQEVTNQLGDQVRRAVETLVQTLDRVDREWQRKLLAGISEQELYEAALTIMMRLVFLLSAEEREMLLLGDPIYDEHYAVSTLHKQLREQADQQGEEVMETRCDAWGRLLAVFRIVFGGVEHVDLRMPPYGGRLFDPDRFPFLEGRPAGSSWREVPARPMRIDNRTVLHLLSALQFLQVRIGGIVEPRRLSFRGLDIEQIGHVYEGLLDHTARRAQSTVLGLSGSYEPEVPLAEIEERARRGEAELLPFLNQETGRSQAALQKSLAVTLDQSQRSRLMGACDNRQDIFERVLPYAGLLRLDAFEDYVVFTPGSFYVTQGSDRRATGTHYTPRSLTEPMVQHALDPLVYEGPAEGWAQEKWRLRSVPELLDLKICDMAMGSGAFLVQTCRYLSEKLVQAWADAEQVETGENGSSDSEAVENASIGNGQHSNGRHKRVLTINGELSQGRADEELLPVDNEERLALARRLVAERCLYGVDKNPMAVEMAKLSLWLITLARKKPFTFLDHNLRGGDSLLGADERQLANWSMDGKAGEVVTDAWTIREPVRKALDTALRLRREINAIMNEDIQDVYAKERLLKNANDATDIVRLGGDLLIAITLTEPKKRPALQDQFILNYALLAQGYVEALHQGQTSHGWESKRAEYGKMRAEIDVLLGDRRPFHWALEFPEVFVGKEDSRGFAAVVGNPPFQGGQKITGALGTDYRDYLVKHIARGQRGSADLCAYFFLQATQITRVEGACAFIATNTIAQGDTREAGLDQIVADGWAIPQAIPSRKWPGEASLEIAQVWLRNGEWKREYVLDDKVVSGITPFLTIPGKAEGNPFVLNANAKKSFIGSYVLGIGFVLESDNAQALIAKNPQNKDVLFPYLNGEDLNSRFDQSPSRWVINFHNWELEQAEQYIDCMKIVREKVKPERDKNNRKVRRERWWQFAERAPALYSTISGMERVLVIAIVTTYLAPVFRPTNEVYSHRCCVFPFDQWWSYTLIQSNFHEAWARHYSSSLKTWLNYSPSDCFETFPFPPTTESLDDIGERYYAHRQSIMLARQEGLTKTYNRFHDQRERAADIVQLRALHKEMDEAVAHAYGWDDLALEHGFHETKHGMRYTISETARREVLDRLLLLNHQRHEEEVKAGLFDVKKGKASKPKGKQTSKGKDSRKGKEREQEGTQDDEVSHTWEMSKPAELPDGLEQGTLF